MHRISAPERSTVELIDALEAGIAAIRSRNGQAAPDEAPAPPPAAALADIAEPVAAPAPAALPAPPAVVAASALVAEMERADVSPVELAKVMGVPHTELNDWISGRAEAPDWALAAIRLVALLPPSARRKILTQPRAFARQSANRSHPFSRIEEL